jgi:hypothetical protein
MPAAPMWGTVFKLDSESDRNAKGDNFKNVVVTAAGMIRNTELFRHYLALREVYLREGFKAKDIETAQGADDAPDFEPGGDADDGKPAY